MMLHQFQEYHTSLCIPTHTRSPHLIEVRERIRINGKPLSKDRFTSYFWDCFDKLSSTKVCTFHLLSANINGQYIAEGTDSIEAISLLYCRISMKGPCRPISDF